MRKYLLIFILFLILPCSKSYATEVSVSDLLDYGETEEREVVVDYSDKSISVNGVDTSLKDELGVANTATSSTIRNSLSDNGYVETERDGQVRIYHNRFENKRLFVKGSPNLDELARAEIVGWTILQFATLEETMNAYERLKLAGYQVFPDEMFSCGVNLLERQEDIVGAGATELNLLPLQEASKKEITVAVLDTGCNMSEHFGDRVLTPVNYTEESDASDTWNDGKGHGTEVISVLLDSTGENVSVLPLKVLSADGVGTQIYLVSAFEDIFANNSADIINICIGWQCVSEDEASLCAFWNDIIAEAINTYQIPVIVAAGNTSTKDTCYPANLDAVWTVGSTGVVTDGIMEPDVISSFSNYGKIDFVARGCDIRTITANGDFALTSGTSVSAPLITSLAAGLLSAKDFLSCEDLYKSIQESCVDLGESGYDMYYGWGRPLFDESMINPCYFGHDYQLVSTMSANCKSPKLLNYECSRCSTTKTEEEGEKDSSVHTGGYRYPISAATCTEHSYKIKTCKGCSAEISRSIFAEATGHSYGEAPDSIYSKLSADETEEITYGVYSCTKCGETETRELSRVTRVPSEPTTEEPTSENPSTTEDPKGPSVEVPTEKPTEESKTESTTSNTSPKKTTITSLKNKSKGKLTVKCSKRSGCRYQFQCSTSKKFKKNTSKKTSGQQCTFTKLKKGKRYYVRVRTMKKVKGKWKYSPWSKVKSVKIKK